MNQYRCETCTNKDPQEYGWCRYVNAYVNVSIIAEFTARCGCASHSEFKINRDKVLSEWATCIHNCVHIHCLGKYNEIVAGYRKSDRDGE